MERLRAIVPRIVDEAKRALDAEVEQMNRASLSERLTERLKLARRGEPRSRRPRADGRFAFWKIPMRRWRKATS